MVKDMIRFVWGSVYLRYGDKDSRGKVYCNIAVTKYTDLIQDIFDRISP